MLNKLSKVTTKSNRRVGRGYGSKKGGHTSGRGTKGQKSRSGYHSPRPGFEGGSMPLSRRVPKLKGFSRGYFDQKITKFVINVSDLNNFADGSKVDVLSLVEQGLIKPGSGNFSIKICGNGELTKKLNLENLSVSKAAEEKITAKGGKILINQ
ncbi:MAG: 50S ribosomal protein L15 [bacterium]